MQLTPSESMLICGNGGRIHNYMLKRLPDFSISSLIWAGYEQYIQWNLDTKDAENDEKHAADEDNVCRSVLRKTAAFGQRASSLVLDLWPYKQQNNQKISPEDDPLELGHSDNCFDQS